VENQVRFGGEFRRAQLEEFYHRHALGNFVFDGSQGPGREILTPTVTSWPLLIFSPAKVSRSSIAVGDPTRLASSRLCAVRTRYLATYSEADLELRLRWDYEGPIGNDKNDLSVFVPSKGGLVFQGAGIDSVYPKDFRNFSPRRWICLQGLAKEAIW